MTVRSIVRPTARPTSRPAVGAEVLGDELIVNGGFGADTNWVKGTGWSIASGVATKTAGTAAALQQTVANLLTGVYVLTYTLVRNAGVVQPVFVGGTNTSGTVRTSSNTYTERLVIKAGNTTLRFDTDAAFAGTIDNVSLRQVIF